MHVDAALDCTRSGELQHELLRPLAMTMWSSTQATRSFERVEEDTELFSPHVSKQERLGFWLDPGGNTAADDHRTCQSKTGGILCRLTTWDKVLGCLV